MRLIQRCIAVTDRSSVGEVRRAAIAFGQSLGFDEAKRSNIGIAATELATNIVLHAQTGEMLLCPSQESGGTRLDLLALDCGPGIRDLGRAMEDGYSTLGTAGQGLGAIKRVSDFSALYSTHGQGTVYWSRFQLGKFSQAAVINLPMAGETVPGDSYFLHVDGRRDVYMMVDGLGHGPGAAEAAEEAVRTVRTHADKPIAEIITRSHDALKKTRGAAMAVAVVDGQKQSVTFGGIGNIGALLVNENSARSLVSQNGTVGAVMPRQIKEFTYPFERAGTLVLFSDGLTSKASPVFYSGHQSRPSILIAGLMYRDFSRRRDDASVMVARLEGGGL